MTGAMRASDGNRGQDGDTASRLPAIHSALYRGVVAHRRTWPRHHYLRYRVWSMVLDLDELPVLHQRLRLFSYNRFNLLSFHDADHGDGSGQPLGAQVARLLAEADAGYDGGPIRLWCMPRVLGYVFNPLSIYFCHRRDGSLCALVHEVNNTFGLRHSYVIPVDAGAGGLVRQRCAKRLHVSPFMDMDARYDFRIAPPADSLSVAIQVRRGREDRGDGPSVPILSAWFTGRRQALDDAAILSAWAAHPLLTLKVMAAIHWQALKLWLKGVGFRPSPPAPSQPVTIVSPADSGL
ncbi:DUF1365 domain-containing protein [Nitrospirillum sp. BR 11828]|uniref:DUF1365 domain-containing protein n=1 Tax=Nitrospirillum sp. BR 11828 TaxID=3104325 RepID=UPI002ACA1A20|nr:DUF1365 family protein [Nitrospirillum sp. BR 11828]MDZ5649652.1 DUF1365 family protein [Nitrospirillum sp. BR 11828]